MRKAATLILITTLLLSLLTACGDITDNTPAMLLDVPYSEPELVLEQTPEASDQQRFAITSDEIGVERHSGFAISLPEGYTIEPLIEEPGIFRGEYRVLDELGQPLMSIRRHYKRLY